ncbi:hypothetical protein CARN8_6100003 [mine drainage metagenome]|uniref:Uncharacterized protein n=1 Tax=mine drainage metagenome TaxID=410659 RepID=A0A3P3ZQV2_9ZZZZ
MRRMSARHCPWVIRVVLIMKGLEKVTLPPPLRTKLPAGIEVISGHSGQSCTLAGLEGEAALVRARTSISPPNAFELRLTIGLLPKRTALVNPFRGKSQFIPLPFR